MLNKLIFTVTLWDSYYYFNSANDELEAEKLNALSKDTASGCNSWYLNHIYLNTKHSFSLIILSNYKLTFMGEQKFVNGTHRVPLQKSVVLYGKRHLVNEVAVSWESCPMDMVLAQSKLAAWHWLLQDSSWSPWSSAIHPFLPSVGIINLLQCSYFYYCISKKYKIILLLYFEKVQNYSFNIYP